MQTETRHQTIPPITLTWIAAVLVPLIGTLGCGDNGNDGPRCGDGVVNPGEECDSGDLQGATCTALGLGPGLLSCSADCHLDTGSCKVLPECGNGITEPGEECDASDLQRMSCEMLHLGGGHLGCTLDCVLDRSGCEAVMLHCGDGVLDPEEMCDGAERRVADCRQAGFDGGSLACSSQCTLDTSGCYLCGNGTREATEICDDGNTVGGDGCSADCRSDESCGNGVLDALTGETCDGSNLGIATCVALGFGGGVLSCDGSCLLDDSSCDP